MGRYYTGDIEGKFWLGVQSSDAGERFGCEAYEPCSIDYHIEEEKIPQVKAELKKIEKRLGEYLKKLDDFFDKCDGYNDEILIKAGFPEDRLHELISEYADYNLGKKILKCLEENGECNFNADL